MESIRNVTETALAQVATVTIDWNDTYQTIDGFGAAQPGGDPNQVPVQDASTRLHTFPESSQVMDLAFSQSNGIGLTILRMKVNAMLEPSPGVWNYNDPAQAWIMQEAVKRGPVKLIASVWSPPAWMKSSSSTVGGFLNFEHYQDFADLLAHYAGQYASTNGVNIYAVSMSNEPDNDKSLTDKDPWDTCVWDADQIATFLSLYLSPTFANNHIATKVIAPEAAVWDSLDSFLTETYNNPVALARVDIVAGHLYGDSSPSLRFQTALNSGKKIWQTEVSGDLWSIDNALTWAKDIHDGLTGAQISAWLWFLMFGGAVDDNRIGCLIGVHPDNSISGSPTFWALGNFSRFIRPGFVRVGTTTRNAPMLDTSAYKDPRTGQFVIVAINSGTSDLKVKFTTLGFIGRNVRPYITSNAQNLAPQSVVSLANAITVPARSIVSYIPTVVSFRRPDGMVLSTGNLYFTAHDAFGAHVFRTAQTSYPGQEIALYDEGPGNQFGDIVYANVGGVFYGYFWAVNSAGQSFIKRILLTGSQTATVLTPPITNIDIVNSHHNLATDGMNLYWQDVSSVKKMPIGGGPITTLDLTTPSTPTAGVYLHNGNIIYASVAAVRYVPTSGAVTAPQIRTIANANAPVTTILPVVNGTYWGDRSGAIQLKLGPTIYTIQASTGLVPTSIGTSGSTAGGPLVWTQCASSTCQVSFNFPGGNWVSPVASHALGASMSSSGDAFWGDDYGVHRIDDPRQHLVDRSGQFGTPPAAGPPTACVIPGLGAHNIAYRDTSGRLHELWRDAQGATGTTNLTANASAPTAQGNPYAYVDTSRNMAILLFRGGDGTVRSLYWSTGHVGHDNLSGTAGAPRAAADPVGYYAAPADTHHVIYRTSDGHLHELWWTGVAPVAYGGDLTALASAPPAAGQPSAFVNGSGDNIVIYRGGNNHIRSLYWTTGAVAHEDLSGFAGTPPTTGDPVAYYTAHNDTHQIVYRGNDGHLWELYWSGVTPVVGWNLTAPSGAPTTAGAPAAYYSAVTNTKHVIYRSADGRLHEIWWVPGGGTPAHVDLTAAYGAPPAADRPAAFTVEGLNRQHVAYRGTDNHIYEVLW